jgi:hypothetical protein
LLFAATRFYLSLHPGEKQFDHRKVNPFNDDDEKDIKEILESVYGRPIHAIPSSYCFENTANFPGK